MAWPHFLGSNKSNPCKKTVFGQQLAQTLEHLLLHYRLCCLQTVVHAACMLALRQYGLHLWLLTNSEGVLSLQLETSASTVQPRCKHVAFMRILGVKSEKAQKAVRTLELCGFAVFCGHLRWSSDHRISRLSLMTILL